MKANGLAPKAVVGAAMRELAHLIYGVVKSGKPFDANFATRGDLQFKTVSDPELPNCVIDNALYKANNHPPEKRLDQ